MRSVVRKRLSGSVVGLALLATGCATDQGTGLLALNISADGTIPAGAASSVVLTGPSKISRSYPGSFPLAGGVALVLEFPNLPASDSPVAIGVQAFDSGHCLVGSATKQVTIKGGVKTTSDVALTRSTAACGDGGGSAGTPDGGGTTRDGSGNRVDGPAIAGDAPERDGAEAGVIDVDVLAPLDASSKIDGTTDAPPLSPAETGAIPNGSDATNSTRSEVADAPLGSETGTDVPLGSGGANGTGGINSSGGTTSGGTGGINGTGGGGSTGTGGNSASGGVTTRDGGSDAPASTGGSATGGATGVGGQPGSGGTTTPSTGPCDIYQSANTPCVAAHSTVRALYAAYYGALYQVRRASDSTTADVPVLATGGFVNISMQDSFCSGTTCTISILYDQSPNRNDLVKSPKASWLPNGGDEASATQGKITINGHTAYGIYVDNSGGSTGVGYRNNATKGLAKNDEPEAMYVVVDGKRYNQWCCFDYGNAGTSGTAEGNGTIEAIYWGASTQWSRGGGNGPWVAADLGNGIFEGDSTSTPSNTAISGWAFVTGMLKGPSGNAFGLKAGDAQSGTLLTKWDGARPPGYSPMNKQGAIILGTSGDGSNNGVGTFFEGAIISGNPPDAADDAVQANIVAAGYGY